MQRCSASSTTPTPRGFRCSCSQLRRLPGEPFLDLQSCREEVDDAGQLGESEDPLAGEVGDVGDAVKWQQVVFAEGVERDVARDHELVVALVVWEGGEVERLGGEHLGVHARHSPGGVCERLVGDVRAQGMEQVSGRVLGRGDVHDGS